MSGPVVMDVSAMRRIRPFYVFPLLVQLALFFSTTSLLFIMADESLEDALYPTPNKFLFFGIAIAAPPSITLSQLLPQPWMGQALGSWLSSAGLVCTALCATSIGRMLAFGLLFGSGLSLSVQSLSISLSPYFLCSRQTVAATILLSATLLSTLVHPMMIKEVKEVGSLTFYGLAVLVFLSGLVPIIGHLIFHQDNKKAGAKKKRRESPTDQLLLLPTDGKAFHQQKLPLPPSEKAFHEHPVLPTHKQELLNELSLDMDTAVVPGTSALKATQNPKGAGEGCLIQTLCAVVWLSWATGVDLTVLALDSLSETNLPVTCFQMMLCYLPLGVKLWWQLKVSGHPEHRLNLASNYMQLGLLGTAGIMASVFPDLCVTYHNHLLFTVGFALQYDDLNDLDLVPSLQRSLPMSFAQRCYTIVKYDLMADVEEDVGRGRTSRTIVCWLHLFCHLTSRLVSAIIALILGFHLANALIIVISLPPFTFLFHRAGLLVLSVTGVGLAFSQPDSWIKSRS